MPLPLVAAFWAALGSVIVPLAIRLLVGLGFAAVTYTGVSALWDSMQTNLLASLGGVSANIITILAMANVDEGITIILSALSAKLALKGLTAAGALAQFRFKGVG